MNEVDFERIAERFCDGYCKFPYICKEAEQLETVCEGCPITKLSDLIENGGN